VLCALLTLIPAAGTLADDVPRASRELLRLVPPQASVILTVDDLRGQVKELMASRLIADLQAVPVVKAWFDSDKYRELDNSRDQIEEALQVSLTEVRDKILGDAVVFALDLPPEAVTDPSKAQGLLAVKASDPALVSTLIDRLNTIQKQNGEVSDIEERSHRGQTYLVRKFPEGSSRRMDVSVMFPDGTLAISNSVPLIQGVIDAKGGKAADPAAAGADGSAAARFLAVQQRLPGRAAARLYVAAGAVSRLLQNAPGPRSAGQAAVIGHLSALESAGAALVVRDDRIALQVAEVFPKAGFQAAAGGVNASASPRMDHFPSTTLAAGSLQVDFPALYKALAQLVPEQDRPRLEGIEAVLRGILLGQDLRSRILPALGPRVTAFVEAPADWKKAVEPGPATFPGGNIPFPIVLVVDLKEPAGEGEGKIPVTAALDNALSTLLAVITLDERHQQGRFRVASRESHGMTIKTLEPAVPFAFTVDANGRRLIVGNSPGVVERFIAAPEQGKASARWHQLAARAFPDAQSFLCLDLAAVQAMIRGHRDGIADVITRRENRPREDVLRDLENVAALAGVFDAAFWSGRTDPPSATAFHTLGLIAKRRDGDGPASKP
jgi:hypothetical protein